MAPLTPAQKAVLERIQKKKEQQQKAALKRKAKTEPAPDTTSNKRATSADGDSDSSSANKRRRVETNEPNNNQVEAPTPNTDQKKGKAAGNAQTARANEAQHAATSSVKTPVRRGRKTAKIDEDPEPTVDEGAQQPTSTSPAKKPVARRGRKTELVEEAKESPANQTMNEAQLKVLQMLEEKKAAKDKGRKSLKPAKPVAPKEEEVVAIDSDSSNPEVAVSSTVPERVPRGRRKTTNLDATLSKAASKENVTTRRRNEPVVVIPVEISDPEEEAPPSPLEPERLLDTQLEEEEEPEDQGPLNATMIAVMERIKEKKAKEPVKKQPARARAAASKSTTEAKAASAAPETPASSTSKSTGPLTPNQISVMKKLQERDPKEPETIAVESSSPSDEEDDDDSPQLTLEEIKAIFERLAKPLNNREKFIVKRLQDEGVYKAVDEGRPLTKEQNAMMVKFRHILKVIAARSQPSASKAAVGTQELSKDESESEATNDEEERDPSYTQPPEEQLASSSDAESEMECAETNPSKTFLIFDTNAYLDILPYCRALLESDKLKDEPDFEELKMFALFVVIRELDFISKRKEHLKQPAMAAIRLIHGALQDQNPRIEGQDYASSKEKLSDSEMNDDYILNSADILRGRGENVIVVTNDKNLQVKVAMMRITSVDSLEFISRFHWLTPCVTANLQRDIRVCGEDFFASFAIEVVVSVVLKGVLAHLAPLPMDRRREIFPSTRLATTLALMLKNKSILQAHNGPFAVLNYDRVAQTLDPLTKFHELERKIPRDGDRFKFFARFLFSAEILCRSIAGYFPNMESRAELTAAIGNHFRIYLPREERPAARRVEVPKPLPERPPVRSEPAAKALLPTRRPLPSVAKHVPEPPKPVAQPSVPDRRRTPASPAAAERARAAMPPPTPEPAVKQRTPRVTRATRARNEEPAQDPPAEPVYFSFSQGREAQSRLETLTDERPSRPYAVTPTRPAARQNQQSSPYSDLHDSIHEDVASTVYEYFQKFGLSICNYTGSCCVKLGVRFSLAFKVSTARLEKSLPEITDSFALVLKSMKKIIVGSPTAEPAREFLLHSSQVMDAIGRSDPDLINTLPKITPDALLSFSRDPEGKQQLVMGYQQFSDFNNCLEKCWLEAQRS